ncbi:hypothetical protein ACWGDX_23490 [Streptomyces sp. NPDC055025]
MAGAFGVGEGGGQSVPAGLGQDDLGEFGQRGAHGGGVMAARGRGDTADTFAQYREGLVGCLPVGGPQLLSGPAGRLGLLGVVSLGVSVRGGDGEEDQHVQDHGGACPVLAPAERGPAVCRFGRALGRDEWRGDEVLLSRSNVGGCPSSTDERSSPASCSASCSATLVRSTAS